MAREDDIHGITCGVLTIGLSTIVGITVIPGQIAVSLKYGAGGSLEIGGASLTWGAGYLFGTAEVKDFNSAATFYVAAKGATVTAYIMRGMAAGAAGYTTVGAGGAGF